MIAPRVVRVLTLLAGLAVALAPGGLGATAPQQVSRPAPPDRGTPDPGRRTPDPGPRTPGRASGHLVLAVVRNDGILLPFAAFNGRKWSAPWPVLQRNFGPNSIELPVNLASVPREWWGGNEPGDWRLWPRNSEISRPLTLLTPVMMRIGLTRQVGFRTDQPPVLPPVPPFELPFPKIGIAVAGGTPLTSIASVSSFAPTWKTFAEALRADINKAEERALGAIGASTNWRHPVKREVRGTVIPELEAWYVTAVGTGDERLSYVEAVKNYPVQSEDDGCGLETFASGWVHHDGQQQKIKTRLSAVVTYCDRRGVSYMLPFGLIRVNDRVHWIVQMSGRDHEWYAVVEGTPDRARYVAEFQAGMVPLNR
jgi:hypothetical protein